jgi:hypothetical protein
MSLEMRFWTSVCITTLQLLLQNVQLLFSRFLVT